MTNLTRYLLIFLVSVAVATCGPTQKYRPLAEMLDSKGLTQEEYSEITVRCAALTSILKIKMEEVQAGGSRWDEISIFFNLAVNQLPEVGGSMVRSVELIRPAMDFYYARMNENNTKHNAMLLGIVQDDMNECIATKKFLEDASNSDSQENTDKSIITKLFEVLGEETLSDETRQRLIVDLCRECISLYKPFIGAMGFVVENDNQQLESTAEAQRNLDFFISKGAILMRWVVGEEMVRTNADKDEAIERVTKSFPNINNYLNSYNSCAGGSKSQLCETFDRETKLCLQFSKELEELASAARGEKGSGR